jgi:hypothetical protein
MHKDRRNLFYVLSGERVFVLSTGGRTVLVRTSVPRVSLAVLSTKTVTGSGGSDWKVQQQHQDGPDEVKVSLGRFRHCSMDRRQCATQEQ